MSQPTASTGTPEPTASADSLQPTTSADGAKSPHRADGPQPMLARTAHLTAATPANTTALAVTSGTSGSQGDYGATTLPAAGTWQASAAGSFTYAYPSSVPVAIGGNAPLVGPSYDSQTSTALLRAC